VEETNIAIIAAVTSTAAAIVTGGYGFLRFVINKVIPKSEFKEVDREMLKSTNEHITEVWKTDDVKMSALKELIGQMKEYNNRLIKQNEKLTIVLSSLSKNYDKVKGNGSN